MAHHRPRHVGVMITCLADLFRPSIGFATLKLLRQGGCRCTVPEDQVCCGQPAYNNGDWDDARAIGRRVIEQFEEFEYVVVPSGSCAGMLKTHYPALFADDPQWRPRAEALATRVHELTDYLLNRCNLRLSGVRFPARVTYHDSCAGLREMGIKTQPRALLAQVEDLTLTELQDSNVCCGFGGTFCVKYEELSERMVADKVAAVEATDAEVLLAGDLGCLLNIAGRLTRENSQLRVYHVAEVLAGMADGPGLGRS